MAEINLLRQSGGSQDFINVFPKILVWVFLFALLGLFAYYGWLIFNIKTAEKNIQDTQAKIVQEKQEAESIGSRFELYTRQSQINTLEGLIKNHVYWSQLFPVLANATLKTASYTTMRAGLDGTLDLSVTVPTVEDLEKYMQIFDLSKYNENFSNIRIGGYSKIQEKNATAIKFQVKMDYKPDLIMYKSGE